MVRARWTLLGGGAVLLTAVCVLAGDVTLKFTAGMAYVIGALVWGASERIIVRTRARPETRLAAARQGPGPIER